MSTGGLFSGGICEGGIFTKKGGIFDGGIFSREEKTQEKSKSEAPARPKRSHRNEQQINPDKNNKDSKNEGFYGWLLAMIFSIGALMLFAGPVMILCGSNPYIGLLTMIIGGIAILLIASSSLSKR